VAPYVKIVQDRPAMHYYQACQTGPSIYDGAGVGVPLLYTVLVLTSLTESSLDWSLFV
jgi:hypothetical protein